MGVHLTASVKAFLPQTILSTKFSLVPTVATLATVIILQTAGTITTEHSVPDPLPALPACLGPPHRLRAGAGHRAHAGALHGQPAPLLRGAVGETVPGQPSSGIGT